MLRATQLLLKDLRWINFKKSLQSTTRNAEVAVCHPPRKWVKDVWTARFFSLRYLSDLQKIQIGVDLIAVWGEVHWMPFQHQIIQSETLWKCWRVELVIVFPPEYNVHNIAGFFPPLFWWWRHLWSLWKMIYLILDGQPTKRTVCWHSLHFPIRSSPGIVFICLWGGWIGRERGKNLTLWRDSLLLRSGKSLDPCPVGFRAIAFKIQRGDESQKGWQVV